MSNTRKSTNPAISTAGVSGSVSTASAMPATSSITMAPGSLPPSDRSASCAAQVPTRITASSMTTSARGDGNRTPRANAVRALATVPGATGAWPTPPTVATRRANRWRAVSGRLAAVGNELVTLDLGDPHAREASGGPRVTATQIDDAVDLRRLARHASFPCEGRVLAGAVHEHVDDGAGQLGVRFPRDRILAILHDRRALGGDLGFDLVGVAGRRCAGFRRVGEDAEPVEPHVLHEREKIVERLRRLTREADQDRGADGHARDRLAELRDDLLHPSRGDSPPHRLQDGVVAMLHGHVDVGNDARACPLV